MASPATTIDLPDVGMRVHIRTSEKADGDFAVDLPAGELTDRRRAFVDLPWAWLRQVHGAAVVTVGADDVAHGLESVNGTEADALVTREPGVALAIHTADCVPVVMVSGDGVLGVAHAGWHGIVAGVLGATVDAMGSSGALAPIDARLRPHIGTECYEFGAADLDRVEAELAGEDPGERFVRSSVTRLRGTTAAGRPALNLRGAVSLALASRPQVRGTVPAAACTACEADRFYSHRARQEPGRMATVAWLEPL